MSLFLNGVSEATLNPRNTTVHFSKFIWSYSSLLPLLTIINISEASSMSEANNNFERLYTRRLYTNSTGTVARRYHCTGSRYSSITRTVALSVSGISRYVSTSCAFVSPPLVTTNTHWTVRTGQLTQRASRRRESPRLRYRTYCKNAITRRFQVLKTQVV